MVIILAINLVADLALRDRRAEIIARLNVSGDFLAQPCLRLRRRHDHLKLRLLVFLHAEKTSSREAISIRITRIRRSAVDAEGIDAQGGLFIQDIFARDGARVIRRRRERGHPAVFRVPYFDPDGLAGVHIQIPAIFTSPDPHAEFHRSARTVDGPVGDDVITGAVIERAIVVVFVPVLEK